MPSSFALQDQTLLSHALDALPFGFAAVSASGELLYANAWVTARLREHEPSGFLGLWDTDSRHRLAAALPLAVPGSGVRELALGTARGDYVRVSLEARSGLPAAVVVTIRSAEDGADVTGAVEDRRLALIEIGNLLRDLEDPTEIAYRVAEIIDRTLKVSRAGYGTIDRVAETITVERDWNAPGIQTLAGVLHFRDYGSYIDELKRGVTTVITDARTDPRTAATADALAGITALSFINMPVTERGGFVALLYLNHEHPREWSEEEISFVSEVASRTRVAVERRRAEHE